MNVTTDPWGKKFRDTKYGNCMLRWSVDHQVWQVWYCEEIVYYEYGMKPCIDWIRAQRIAGLLTHDAYREFSNAKRPRK